jgi:hypothetical protein
MHDQQCQKQTRNLRKHIRQKIYGYNMIKPYHYCVPTIQQLEQRDSSGRNGNSTFSLPDAINRLCADYAVYLQWRLATKTYSAESVTEDKQHRLESANKRVRD